MCRKPDHIARDCVQQWEPPTCYRCNAVGHVATKCRVRDVYCQIYKNKLHVTDAYYTKRAPRTTAATAGSAPRIHATQETDHQVDRVSSRSEELWAVSQRMMGSAFATAVVSTSASGIHNFSPQIKVLADTGNLLSIGLCVSESFFLSLGGKLRESWGIYCHRVFKRLTGCLKIR